ncbi:MAG: 50S ribosomal protein L1 [Patescibacteria group bacterium]
MHGKKYLKSLSLIDKNKIYAPEEAIALAKQTSNVRFDATLELHFRLGIDPTKGEQLVRGSAVLPHSFGKSKKVVAFVPADKEKEAKEAGADIVGGEELIKEIAESKKCDFDVAIATPDMMPKLAKVAKILGPRGLMPNPKTDTVGPNIKKMITEQKAGKIDFKNDDKGNVHLMFGKVSMDKDKLLENLKILAVAVKKAKPATSKGNYIRNAVLVATMGPSIKITI